MDRLTYISLPDTVSRPLPFYLAMEEYVARHTEVGAFFMWQVEPTVIFGRHQVIDREVNLDYCRRRGIKFFRRKSGGGCVYANRDNIMLSCIRSGFGVADPFADYTSAVAASLRSLGLPAEANGRNDVLVDGRKVSGSAFYQLPGRHIAHGTMLFSTDPEDMANAITPSEAKMRAKGVESVRSRITTISEHLPDLTIEQLKEHFRRTLTDSEMSLTPDDVREIERIAMPYYDRDWIYGCHDKAESGVTGRIDGVGEIGLHISTSPLTGLISSMTFTGDFFCKGNPDQLASRFVGLPLSPEGVGRALAGIDPSDYISGLTKDKLKKLIFHNHD